MNVIEGKAVTITLRNVRVEILHVMVLHCLSFAAAYLEETFRKDLNTARRSVITIMFLRI